MRLNGMGMLVFSADFYGSDILCDVLMVQHFLGYSSVIQMRACIFWFHNLHVHSGFTKLVSFVEKNVKTVALQL